jgi:hypothetical protein
VRLLDRLEGSPGAKKKLRVLLETLAGERTVRSACGELGVSEAMFHKLRSQWLEDALRSLEPKPKGRPRKERSPEETHTEELREQMKTLELELKAAQVREEIAVAMPYLARRHWDDEKKTTGRSSPRRRKNR